MLNLIWSTMWFSVHVQIVKGNTRKHKNTREDKNIVEKEVESTLKTKNRICLNYCPVESSFNKPIKLFAVERSTKFVVNFLVGAEFYFISFPLFNVI